MDAEHDELDTFLRRAARMAVLGAAVGAVVGAARSARHASANGAVEEERPEPEELEEERPQAEAVQEPEIEDEADESEQDEPEQREAEPQARDTDEPQQQQQQQQEEAEEAERSEEPEPQPSNGGGDELAKRVLQRLQELTGREPDAMLGLKRQDGGWLMSVEVVELRRVPSTTDVLATYEVVVDEDGEIQEYRRTGRYVRGRGETE